MNLLTFIAPLAVAATFMMPADAAKYTKNYRHWEILIFKYSTRPLFVFVPTLFLIILLPMLTE